MKILDVLGITVIMVWVYFYEWPRIEKNQKKERRTFVVLTIIGWSLAILLVFFPDIPGPTDFIREIFKPIEKWLG
ncbi:hypothetical protein [Alteribacillus bidgolensis]|uniref:Uncharacterized protein n=1 Tax=Alteribacillus bidgolensis TaxID=930129 RepID=A0A1G8FZI7_9BACI|nr:hypothetical protein [Alteribacillus bidgolensis]SDH87525.1 hypothetical protein SAMN05216352_103157 [Alteribacillus bidgolensis]